MGLGYRAAPNRNPAAPPEGPASVAAAARRSPPAPAGRPGTGGRADPPPVCRPEDLGLGRLLWTIREAVVIADAGTGRIALWNPAAEALFGYYPAEALGRPLGLLLPARRRAAWRSRLARYRAAGLRALVEGTVP